LLFGPKMPSAAILGWLGMPLAASLLRVACHGSGQKAAVRLVYAGARSDEGLSVVAGLAPRQHGVAEVSRSSCDVIMRR
jgi:hypothetical protein